MVDEKVKKLSIKCKNRMVNLKINAYKLGLSSGVNRSNIGRFLSQKTSLSLDNYIKLCNSLKITLEGEPND